MNPAIRTIYRPGNHHPFVALVTEVTTEGELFCGDSWCAGRCGHRALVIQEGDKQLKCYSSMVACGPVWQRFRLPWTGATCTLAAELVPILRERYWL